jgi:hypothetical protein
MIDTIHKNFTMYNSEDVLKTKPEKPSPAAFFQKHAADYLMTMRSVYYNGCLYTYRNKCYRPEQEPEVILMRYFQQKQIALKSSDVSNILAHVKAYSLMDAQKFPAIPFFIKGESREPKDFIPFQNGLLNLDQHCQGLTKLTPHTPDFVSLYALPFDFDPEAQCPKWLGFLGQIFEGDEARIRLLQEWFGYCLPCRNSWFCWGCHVPARARPVPSSASFSARKIPPPLTFTGCWTVSQWRRCGRNSWRWSARSN